MKNSNHKAIAGLFALLSSAGVVHADDGMFGFKTVPIPQYQNTVDHLLREGILYQVPGKTNWYGINQQQLNYYLMYQQYGHQDAKSTVDMLKGLVGDGTDVQSMNWMHARIGTQDVSIGFARDPWDLDK